MNGGKASGPHRQSFNNKASTLSASKEQDDLVRLLFFAMRFAENLKNADVESDTTPGTTDTLETQESFFDALIESLFPEYKEHPEKIGLDARSGLDDFRNLSRGRYASVAERDAYLNQATQRYAEIYEGKYQRNAIVKDSLLNLIAGAESGGNYNVRFGGKRDYDLESMTVHEVRALQRQLVRGGSPSSAMGRYQIMGYTMDGLIKEMGLTGNEKFDRHMQDAMAIKLAERRGLNDFLEGKISASRFANKLSMEWAGIKNSAGVGHYDGDGLNRGSLGHNRVVNALGVMRDEVRVAESGQLLADSRPKPPGSGGPAAGM